MILIGLDPGKETGVAVWDCQGFRFLHIGSMPIHRTMVYVLEWYSGWRGAQQDANGQRAQVPMLVVWEDARLRRWGFDKMDEKAAKYGNAVREGAGAAKRDAQIWQDFLDDHSIPHLPKKPHKTKQDADAFNRVAGGKFRTNEHTRDAGFLVVQTNEPIAQGMLRSIAQARAKVS